MPESISILPALIKLGGFQYCANHGNIGDLLIDIATRQFFRRHHLPAQENLIGMWCMAVAEGSCPFTVLWMSRKRN